MIWSWHRIKRRLPILFILLTCGYGGFMMLFATWFSTDRQLHKQSESPSNRFSLQDELLKIQSTQTATVVTKQIGYLQISDHDVTLGDMACDDVKNCTTKILQSPEQAKSLCNEEHKCKGFAYRTSSNEVFFKNNVTGKIIPKYDITLYIKKEHAQCLQLPLTGNCAVPLDDEILKNVTDGCNLAEIDPFDPIFTKNIKKPENPLQCHGERLTRYRNGVLEFVSKGTEVAKAEYFPINRTPQSDFGFIEGTSKLLDPNATINKVNDEFVRVVTTTQDGKNHTEYHAAVVPKPDVVARSKHNKGLPVNVLIVGIDSISNAHFQRALPDAYRFLTDELKSIVMKGYTIVGDGTTPALTAFLTGYFETELPEARRGFEGSQTVDNWPWIFKDYNSCGYATMFSEDTPSAATFNYRLYGFKHQPTDHFSRYFWLAAGLTSTLCIHSKPQHLIHLDYIETFFQAYSTTPKFGFGYFTEVSHNNLNSVYYFNEDLTQFLKNFKRHLNDTILIVLGDHGIRYGESRAMLQGHLEERLPFLSFSLPRWFEEKYPEIVANLRHNVKSVTSPFDLHLTLRHILTYPDVPKPPQGSRGSSLFEKIPKSRDCEAAGVAEHYCPCLNLKTADTTHKHIELGALAVVEHINKMLSTDKFAVELCHPLKVQQILSSHQQMPNTKFQQFLGPADIHGRVPRFSKTRPSLKECNYRIQIRTSPGGGLFEAPVRFKDDKFVVTGDISRINKYGEQPRCIADKKPLLRKYCLCKSYNENP